MSDPSTTTPMPPQPTIPQPQSLILGGATAPSSSSSAARQYRKGNWTIQETLILITAKKLDDERRQRTSSTPQDPTRPACSRTSGELRWKWVENYCWSQGCLRSQNQCNDKWDNLLRDYKKVRDYESKSSQSSNNNTQNDFPSYWTITKQQRKEHNLPSNMLFEIYQAISQVYPRKLTQTILSTTTPQPLVTLVTSSPLQTLPPPPNPPPPLALPLQQPPPPPPPPQPPANSTTSAASGNVAIN